MNFISTVIIELLGEIPLFPSMYCDMTLLLKGLRYKIGVASWEKAFLELH